MVHTHLSELSTELLSTRCCRGRLLVGQLVVIMQVVQLCPQCVSVPTYPLAP